MPHEDEQSARAAEATATAPEEGAGPSSRAAEAPSDPPPSSEGAQLTAVPPSPDVAPQSAPPKERGGLDRGQRAAAIVMALLLASGLALWAASSLQPPAAAPSDGGLEASELAVTSAVAPRVDVPDAAADASEPVAARHFRVRDMAKDAGVEIIDVPLKRSGLAEALASAGVARREARRVVSAIVDARRSSRVGRSDSLVLARSTDGSRVLGFELATDPAHFWQGREVDGKLVVSEVTLPVSERRVVAALRIEDALAPSLSHAGLDESLAELIDSALDGHVDLAEAHHGARMRVVATEVRVDGELARYRRVDALEFHSNRAGREPLRLYHYDGAVDSEDGAQDKRRARARGHFTAKGQQPYHGGLRSPVPGASITSRFNPKRRHPVLKVVMPHNGIDFRGSTGTPVYAAADGTVASTVRTGPCGNMVQLSHAGGLVTAYCHLSRFAPSLRPGQSVEARQLVGYVGATGRVTGPHLHFAVKKNGRFIDPLSLRFDGVKVLPPADRDAFQRRRGELDAVLDAIPLPAGAEGVDAGAPEQEEEEKVLDTPDLPDAAAP